MCHDFHVASCLLPVDDKMRSAIAMEASFDDSSLGARSASATFQTESGTLITSEFHRVSQIGYDNTIDVTFPTKMYRLHSRPRYTLVEAEGTGKLISSDYDTGFITKYKDAYRSEVAAFLEDVRQGAAQDDHHMLTCVRAMWMVQMAMDASQSGKESLFKDYKQS